MTFKKNPEYVVFEFSLQVLSESLIETDVEIARLQDISRNDVVVFDQVEMRHSQVEAKNSIKFMNAASGAQQIKRLKAEEFELKKILNHLEKKYRDIEGTIGLLGNKKLLKDYSNTFIDLDKTQGRVELEVPISPASRKRKKVTKTA